MEDDVLTLDTDDSKAEDEAQLKVGRPKEFVRFVRAVATSLITQYDKSDWGMVGLLILQAVIILGIALNLGQHGVPIAPLFVVAVIFGAWGWYGFVKRQRHELNSSRIAALGIEVFLCGFFVVECLLIANKRTHGTPIPHPSASAHHTPAKTIPADVTYTIIDKNIVPGIKRSLDIRLNRKVSKDVLEAIAVKLKSSDPNNYERTFIGYYLPGMTVDAGYWATTHFNPTLEVRVLGITAEQEKKLRQQPTDRSGEVIGRWLQEDEPFPGRITIFRDGGAFYMEKTYTDGNTGKDRMVEKPSRKGRKFMKAKRSGADGDYYLIDKHGGLQIWSQDVDGKYILVLTAKAIAGKAKKKVSGTVYLSRPSRAADSCR